MHVEPRITGAPPPTLAARPWVARGLIALLTLSGLGATVFGYVMVRRFQETTAVWTPAQVSVLAGGVVVGDYPDAVTSRQLLELMPGHGIRIALKADVRGAALAHIYVLRTSANPATAQHPPALWAAQPHPGGENPAPLRTLDAHDAAPDGRAGMASDQLWVELSARDLAAQGDGAYVLVAGSAAPIGAASLREWERVLPALEGHPHGSVVWTRVEVRENPALLRAH